MELSSIGNDLQFDTNIDGPDDDEDEGEAGGFSDVQPTEDDSDYDVDRGVKA